MHQGLNLIMKSTNPDKIYPDLDMFPDLIVILDAELKIIEANIAFCSRAGITGDDAIGSSICTILDKNAAQGKWLTDNLCIPNGKSNTEIPVEFQFKSAELAGHFLATLSLMESENDRDRRYLLILRDVSDIQCNDVTLHQEMKLLEDLLENANDMVQSMDPEGRFIYVNRIWREKMGYSRDEIKNMKLQDILAPECASKCYNLFTDVMQGKKLGWIETVFIAKDGTKIIVEGNCNCRIENGKAVATRGIFRDITDKKQKEKERQEFERHMQQLQKLESLGLMAGGIAHDFNNLLMGILGFAELSLMREKPSKNIATYIKNIEQAARRAAELTNQMLAYSGHGRYKVGYLDFTQIVKESQFLLTAAVSRKIQMEYDLDASLPLVEADIDQIRQLLINLVTNANEALQDNTGTISITTGSIYADQDYLRSTYIHEKLKEGQYVFIKVEDTGPGIDEEMLSRIFDPFFTTKFTGRGLGLAAVLGIVRGHHGAIKVDSIPGEGTSITVLIPAYEERKIKQPYHETAVITETPLQQITVLLVEDEPTVRQVASLMISDMGLNILEARDGQEGLYLFTKHRDKIALVITDMLMSGMNGMELLKKIRQSGADVPVILSSGYNKQDIVSSVEEKELAGFIHKPYSETQLKRMVRGVLQLNGAGL